MTNAIYLYCLAGNGLPTIIDPEGTTGRPAFVLSVHSGVWAVVGQVPLEDFSGPSAEENLADLEWVGPRALHHQEIIQAAMQWSPVFPARFGTLFSSEESLCALVKTNYQAIDDFLDRVSGKDEWAVKGMLSKTKAGNKLMMQRADIEFDALAGMSPGLRYFKEKQLQAEVEKDIVRWLKDVMSAIADDLTICSFDRRKRKIVAAAAEDGDRTTVVNWAFLVNRESLDSFTSRLDRAENDYGDYGLTLDLSGPWPPYSFVPPLQTESEK